MRMSHDVALGLSAANLPERQDDYLKSLNYNLSPPQSLPDDILVMIVAMLCVDSKELYAPLICSRVCSRWRQVVMGAPLLWTFVDISRSRHLTQLWILNSKHAWLDIRLCDPPASLRKYPPPHALLDPPCLLPGDSTIDDIKLHIYRWRSVDISFSCICRTLQILQFLGRIPALQEPLHIDSLTIGPMGQTTLIDDGESSVEDALSIFQNLQVRPAILRVDTFPAGPSPVFSPRLTVLHFFTYCYRVQDLLEWHRILSATPNLVELKLWDSVHKDTTSLPIQEPINLPSLKQLSLTGLFVQLAGLFALSPLPSLESLLLDSLDPCGKIPQQIADIASVSPSLNDLSIGCSYDPRSNRWIKPLLALRSLESISFIEMEWEEIVAVLEQLNVYRGWPIRVRFERIYDIKLDDLARLEASGHISTTELVGCMGGTSRRCSSPDTSTQSERESGSNYSDGTSFEYIFESTSEESSSGGSEPSYEWPSDEGEEDGNN